MNINSLGNLGMNDFEHHLKKYPIGDSKKTWRLDKQFTTISVGDYVPNTWVMLNFDIHQPLAKRI
jgi:hypothetical protein